MASRKTPSNAHGAGVNVQSLIGRELSEAVVFFHEAVAASLGMSAAEWKCLGLLSQHGA